MEEAMIRQALVALQQELEHYTKLVAMQVVSLSATGGILATGSHITGCDADGVESKRRYVVVLATGDAASDLSEWATEQGNLRTQCAEAVGATVIDMDRPPGQCWFCDSPVTHVDGDGHGRCDAHQEKTR